MLNKIGLKKSTVIASLMLMVPAVTAQEACFSLDTALTVVRTQEYAPLIAEAAQGITPEQVEFISFVESGSWSLVYAATPVADPGYFFFENVSGKKQFKDVWGGLANASEHDNQVAWANALGAPPDIAQCFADLTATDN